MTEPEVKERLERALRRRMFECVWNELLEEGLVRDYLNNDLEDDPKEAWRVLKEAMNKRQYLAERAVSEASEAGWVVREELRRGAGERPEQFTAVADLARDLPGPGVLARADALSELWAGLADRDPEVIRFRDEVLGGRLLTVEETEELFTIDEAEVFLNTTALSGLVRRLATLYDWEEAWALNFLLTGEPPQVWPIVMTPPTTKTPPGALTQRTITLTVSSWVPAKVVEGTYRWLQHAISPGRNRGPKELCWEVAGFVWKEKRQNGRVSWPVLLERWHREHPDKPFKSPDRFHECFRRAAKTVVPLPFEYPEPNTHEQALAEVRAREERIKKDLTAHTDKTKNPPLS
jgi:hypothetical protein